MMKICGPYPSKPQWSMPNPTAALKKTKDCLVAELFSRYGLKAPPPTFTPQKRQRLESQATTFCQQALVATRTDNANSVSIHNKHQLPPHAFKGIPPIHHGSYGKQQWLHWLVNSGASCHMTPHKSDFTSLKTFKTKVKVANGSLVPATHIGSVELTIVDRITSDSLTVTLQNVLLVPNIDRRLISTDALNEQGHMVLLIDKMASIFFNYKIPDQPTVRVNAPSQYVLHDKQDDVDWTQDELDLAIEATTVDGKQVRTLLAATACFAECMLPPPLLQPKNLP